ncbi:MAG: LytR/AlgR family response regulator transcription factor [Flavobacteriales bacterium]
MKKKILIVEDDAVIALSLSLYLSQLDYDVVGSVNNAKDAWEKCKELSPDLVILDVQLYGKEKGFFVANQIRKYNQNIKIIYVTAYNDVETVNELMKSNPDLYLTKPYSKEVLSSNIEIALKKEYVNNSIIEIHDNNALIKIDLNDVVYLQSEGNYVNIFFHNQPKMVIREKLMNLEGQLLENAFLRTHLRYIVNEKFVDVYKSDELMANGVKIPISRTYKNIVKEHYTNKSNT